MATVTISDNALLMAMLAEHQDALEEAVDKATIEYLHAQEFARNRLQKLREAIDMRDAMQTARKYVGEKK
jgi:hypothetical protein